jgi:pyruvate kinase
VQRQTKIVATLGPATDEPQTLAAVLAAGVDVVRLNFSHGHAEDHLRRAEAVRTAASALHRQVAVLGDLQGPKIRIASFRAGTVTLEDGKTFVLDPDLPENDGSAETVGLAYRELHRDVVAGDVLLLDDGRLELWVEQVVGRAIRTLVRIGGVLSGHKGLNRRGGGLSAPALTRKDRQDIELAARIGVDYLAVSFVKTEDDLNEARGLLLEAGHDAAVVAKIERTEAVTNITDIMWASDAVMVARGDLGVEIGDAALAGVQKDILRRAGELDCVVITATQMMETMVERPMPTRAEVLDVANAVLDGTDAVMLSAETAVGRYPVQVVESMDRICRGAEEHWAAQSSPTREQEFERVDEAIAKAAVYAANHFRIKAIAALTESGASAMWISRVRSHLPLYAITVSEATARRVALYRGVHPVLMTPPTSEAVRMEHQVLERLYATGAVESGDLVMFTLGDEPGMPGATNTMKILRVAGTGSP